MRYHIALLCLMLIGLGGRAVVADELPITHPEPPPSVSFSAAQQEQIWAMLVRQQSLYLQRLETIGAAQMELQELYLAEQWDAERIGELYDTIFAQQKLIIKAMVERHNQIYTLLTPQQREVLKAQQRLRLQRFKELQEMQQRYREQRRNHNSTPPQP